MLVGKSEGSGSNFEKELEKLYGTKFEQGNIWQIPVPEEMVHKNFDKLFHFLLTRHELIALGLYRLPQANMNDYPFVLTNPSPKTMITIRDRVFVLGKHIPGALIIDFAFDEDYGEAGKGKNYMPGSNREDFYGYKTNM